MRQCSGARFFTSSRECCCTHRAREMCCGTTGRAVRPDSDPPPGCEHTSVRRRLAGPVLVLHSKPPVETSPSLSLTVVQHELLVRLLQENMKASTFLQNTRLQLRR